MTKRATAPAPPADAREAKAAAFARVQARYRAPRFAEIPDHRTGGSTRWQADDGGTAAARDLGEWLDDRIIRTPLAAPCDTLIGIFELCRSGADGARDAVAYAASELGDPGVQFGVWSVINGLPGGPASVDALRAALAREWRARGLADAPDRAIRFPAEPMNRDLPRPTVTRYKTPWGQPAGIAV
jgi:hypothetical protein